jgi:hypothetical protein
MSKYRFKTEEEFKRDGLWVNNNPYGWNSSGCMNKYLGQDIPDSYNTICDKYEKFIYETWSFLPSGYVLKETAFVLPSKWCVKVDRDCQPEEVYKWRQCSWVDAGYINSSTIWTGVVLDNYTEITLEQFKQHVLKESPVVESPKEISMDSIQEEAKKRFPIGCKFIPLYITDTYTLKEDTTTYTIYKKSIFAHYMSGELYNNGEWATLVSLPESEAIDMKDIQEEAKKRFPIGCKFIPVGSTNIYTLLEDSCTYKIHYKHIYAHDCHGSLYNNGKWATLVSLPETKKEMFYAGDYIVTLDVEDGYNCARKNYCFKQRITNKGITPEVDLRGVKYNSHTAMSFDKKSHLKDWRYATPEEAAEYERIGKPYDVTTLQKKEESIPEYVECIEVPRGWSITKKGDIYKIDSFDSVNGYFRLIFDKGGQRVTSEKHCFKPSTKEAYEAQNAPKEESIPEYVECVRSSSGGFTVGKIYNWPNPIDDKGVKRPIGNIHGAIWGFKPSTKEAYDAKYTPKQLTKEDLVEGEIYLYDDSHISTYPVGPSIAIKDKQYTPNERWMWSLSIKHATEEQKALLRSYMKKDEKQEWLEGTYAVGVKGNFGIFDSSNPIIVGQIYTIKENRETYVVVKESEYWVYKYNLNWFATYQEALNFSNQLKPSPVPKESDTSELTPLEICKQKYRKGMRVMSADNSGMYSGEFIIEVDPDKFTKTGGGIDYQHSKGWLCMGDKYAEILEDNACEISSHEPFIKEVVKTQPNEELIKPIYSVNIDLVVKNKKNKIIF